MKRTTTNLRLFFAVAALALTGCAPIAAGIWAATQPGGGSSGGGGVPAAAPAPQGDPVSPHFGQGAFGAARFQ